MDVPGAHMDTRNWRRAAPFRPTRRMEFVVPRTAKSKQPTEPPTGLPLAALATRLIGRLEDEPGTVLCIMRSERRAGLLAGMVRDLEPKRTALHFAGWDCV